MNGIISDSMKDWYIRLFSKVFDENNNVKACGRENCKQLIELADLIEKGKKHGNILTGCMNVDSVIELKVKLTA